MGKVLGTEMVEIGKRIRNARKMKGLTQTEFGNRIGKSLRAVQLYEKGHTDISIGVLFDIAKELDVDPAQLVGYKSPADQTKTLSDILAIVFKIYDLKKLNYNIEVHRPPHDDCWKCDIIFEGKDEAEFNADLCLALESFQDEIIEYTSGKHSRERFEEWQQTMLTYYSNNILE